MPKYLAFIRKKSELNLRRLRSATQTDDNSLIIEAKTKKRAYATATQFFERIEKEKKQKQTKNLLEAQGVEAKPEQDTGKLKFTAAMSEDEN